MNNPLIRKLAEQKKNLQKKYYQKEQTRKDWKVIQKEILS